jgi:hypothetical protein
VARKSILDRIFANIAATHARGMTRKFFAAVKNATRTQDELLLRLVRGAADSDFGRHRGFKSIRTYADFQAAVPIQTYADMSNDIQRLRRGETTALLGPDQKVLMFAMTSGTTAEPKYIPITKQVLDDCRAGWNIWGLKALLDHPRAILRHIVQVTSPMNDHLAPSGVPCGAITGLLAATQKKLVRRYYTSPLAIAQITDAAAKYYTIMRLAIPKDVAWMVTANPATLLALARCANEHRETIIRDIHDGTLSEKFAVDGVVRDVLSSFVTRDVQRARQLEEIVRRSGNLFPRDYWQLDFVAHWMGGTMGLYRAQFPEYFGDVPARDIGLIASEGRMSVPIDDGTAAGILAVTSQFFEFIPAEEYGTAHPTVLRSHEVREGQEYFLVLTNASGLYRYDMGDRVRVTGWSGEAPLIEFLSRDAHTCSLAGEKLTEHQVVSAMQAVTAGSAAAIVNFVLAPQWGTIPRYRLYVEESPATSRSDLSERLDKQICSLNVEYAGKRQSLRLGSMELSIVPDGVLQARDSELRKTRSRTSEQFKHQYLLTVPGADADLSATALHAPPCQLASNT